MSGTTTNPSFDEIQFPPGISYGATGGPGFKTTLIESVSGYEQRNQDWVTARGRWDVGQEIKTQSQLNTLVAFFRARRGRARGFRFKDWSDFKNPYWVKTPGDADPIQVMFTTDGATKTFQITKTYVDPLGINDYVRVINKPVAGSVQLTANGDPNADFTVDTTTGIITLAQSIYSTKGVAIGVSCLFDVPVRFDTDDMKVQLINYNVNTWGQIPLVELRPDQS